jgi:hypothetical protein
MASSSALIYSKTAEIAAVAQDCRNCGSGFLDISHWVTINLGFIGSIG